MESHQECSEQFACFLKLNMFPHSSILLVKWLRVKADFSSLPTPKILRLWEMLKDLSCYKLLCVVLCLQFGVVRNLEVHWKAIIQDFFLHVSAPRDQIESIYSCWIIHHLSYWVFQINFISSITNEEIKIIKYEWLKNDHVCDSNNTIHWCVW